MISTLTFSITRVYQKLRLVFWPFKYRQSDALLVREHWAQQVIIQ